MERRHFAVQELRFSDGSQPKIEGYAATFNTEAKLPGFIEVIRPGAFDRAIREKHDVVCLFNHDANHVLGRTTSGTLRIEQDRKGLYYTCDLPGTQAARDLHESIKRGDIKGCSFAFTIPNDDGQTWTQRGKDVLREITDLDLHDVSPVTYPCYQNTIVSARTEELVAELRRATHASEIRLGKFSSRARSELLAIGSSVESLARTSMTGSLLSDLRLRQARMAGAAEGRRIAEERMVQRRLRNLLLEL